MKIRRRICAAFGLLFHQEGFASASSRRRYEQFQALGFGIYTGGAKVILGTNESCMATFVPPDGCGPNNTVSVDVANVGLVCVDCLILNPECGCNKTTLECSGSTGTLSGGELQCYLGFNNVEEDVLGRINIMQSAVDRAYEVSDKDDRTLKIFNAPEFFWRGQTGGYRASSIFPSADSQFNALNQIAQALEQMVQQEKFKDWLFIFGTIIAAEPIIEGGNNTTNNNETQFAYYNFAPVYKGFDPLSDTPTGKRFLIPKRYISQIDFLERNDFSPPEFIPTPIDPEDYDDKFYDNAGWNTIRTWLEENNYTLVDNNFFVMDHMSFSIEICRDHLEAAASNNFPMLSALQNDAQVPIANDGLVEFGRVPPYMAQISLITSAGMQINPLFVMTNGGSIFLQDGLKPNQPELRINCTVARLPDNSLTMNNCVQQTSNQPFVSVNIYNNDTADEETWEEALAGLYSVAQGFVPQIHVFDPAPVAQLQEEQQEPTTSPTTQSPTMSHADAISSGGVCKILLIMFAFAWLVNS